MNELIHQLIDAMAFLQILWMDVGELPPPTAPQHFGLRLPSPYPTPPHPFGTFKPKADVLLGFVRLAEAPHVNPAGS